MLDPRARVVAPEDDLALLLPEAPLDDVEDVDDPDGEEVGVDGVEPVSVPLQSTTPRETRSFPALTK